MLKLYFPTPLVPLTYHMCPPYSVVRRIKCMLLEHKLKMTENGRKQQSASVSSLRWSRRMRTTCTIMLTACKKLRPPLEKRENENTTRRRRDSMRLSLTHIIETFIQFQSTDGHLLCMFPASASHRPSASRSGFTFVEAVLFMIHVQW